MHEGPIIPPRRDPGCLPREMSLSSLEAQPSASCPSSPTAAICCWRINRGAALLTSKLLLIMPSDLPTERRTSYWQCRRQSTVLPSRRVGEKQQQQQTFDLALRWTQRQLQHLPFINLARVLPFVEAVLLQVWSREEEQEELFLLMAFTASVNIVIVGDKWARALGSPAQGGTVMPQSWPVSTAQGAAQCHLEGDAVETEPA